jgi:hypothetical protein
MTSDWDLYQAGSELREIADELGVALVTYRKQGRDNTYFGMITQAGHEHAFICDPQHHDFFSMFEVLGFLRAIKMVKDFHLRIPVKGDKESVPLRDMRERARELIRDNKKSLEYRRGVGELLAAMLDRDDGFGLEQATMATLKGIGFSRNVYPEEG